MSFADTEADGDLDLVAFGNGVGSEDTPRALVYENVYPSPTGLTAEAGTGEVTLNWEAVAGSETANYVIYSRPSPIDSLGGPASLTPVDSVGPDATSYTDTGLDDGQTYYYRVTAAAATREESPFRRARSFKQVRPSTESCLKIDNMSQYHRR